MQVILKNSLGIAKRIFTIGAAALCISYTAAPFVAADNGSGGNTSCTPVQAPANGTTKPTGAAASTFTFNACTGLWENQYYAWNPVTKYYTPKYQYIFKCDTSNWQWYYEQWVFSPVSQSYRKIPVSVSQLPAGGTVDPSSPNPCAPLQPSQQQNNSSAASTVPSSGGGPEHQTGPAPNTSLTLDKHGNVIVDNKIGATSESGIAQSVADTAVGSTASGNATVMSNVINSVQSSSSLTNPNVLTFTANINGDVQGNLIIDPNQLQPASSSKALTNSNTTINTRETGTLNNSINLKADSGNATAAKNTSAGNVTSGNATAIANVINILNSAVSAGKSFIGVVNINGNLHGNILMPQQFLGQLLATNAPHTTMTLSAADAVSLGIANHIQNSASTGTALASDNTSSGNVTSGDASTKVTVFNLTGAQISGKNCILVFVNVAGTWVGVIMNAPAGATAAAMGDQSSTDSAISAQTNATVNNSITNNINLVAASGSATATKNTAVGDVHSGNADTAVNLLNLNNAQLNLSGWFGVLFINVFGNWFGNFGAYTPPATHAVASGGSASRSDIPQSATYTRPVFQFVAQAHDAVATRPVATESPTLALVSKQLGGEVGKTLGARTIATKRTFATTPAVAHAFSPLRIAGVVIAAGGIAMMFIERALVNRKEMR